MAQKHDLIKIFGLEGIIQRKTLLTENKTDVMRKTPNDITLDIKALVDEIAHRASNSDIDGVQECLNAMKLRQECLQEVVDGIRKSMGKK